MTSPAFRPDAWLRRVRLQAAPRPNEDGLEALHRAQAYAIPFENFDILLGRGISLEPHALVDKLVQKQRGGYCFELNSLLLMALEAFGFKARPLLARVHTAGTPTGRGHMLLEVMIKRRRWLADVIRCKRAKNPPEPHQRRTAERLGAPYAEMDTGHYPMLSQPDELVRLLTREAQS